MSLKNKLKKTIKKTASKITKVTEAVATPEGVLSIVAPQLGISNAAIKAISGGHLDPLKIGTSLSSKLIKGGVRAGEVIDEVGNAIGINPNSLKLGVESYESLKGSLNDEIKEKINQLGERASSIAESRSAERANLQANHEQSSNVSSVDLAQNNLFSQIFSNMVKNIPVGYSRYLPNNSAVKILGGQTYDQIIAESRWQTVSIDDYHEYMTDMIKSPLMSTPVSSVSNLISFINGILDKLDDDGAMIEFLACFNYAGDEVVLPNIESKSPLANACLTKIVTELTYKYMSQWINGTYKNAAELDFYREIMSEWLGDEISIAHPMYTDMLSSAVISLKGHTIARYLLESELPYLWDSTQTSMINRYHETKDNPYDLLQYCRNMLLTAQLNYSEAIKVTFSAARIGICGYHQYSYLILTLCVKLLQDATVFMKNCMTTEMITRMHNDLIVSTDMDYVFELCNNELAWIHCLNENDLSEAIVEAQIEDSGIGVGDDNISYAEMMECINSMTSTLSTSVDIDYTMVVQIRGRIYTFRKEIEELNADSEITDKQATEAFVKIDNLISIINERVA